MRVLWVVRHGQASFGQRNYDQLSPAGAAQGRALGEYLIRHHGKLDHVYVGPRQRHRQTFEALAEAYDKAGIDLPAPSYLEALDEHQSDKVFRRALPILAREDPGVRELLAELSQAPASPRVYRKLFGYLSHRWIREELDSGEYESWQAFRARAARAVEEMTACDLVKEGQRCLAVTSGGTISALVGHALDLSDEKVLELNYQVKNASLSEFVFSPKRFSVSVFNSIAHLVHAPELMTYV